MDEPTRRQRRSPHPPVWWALALSTVTTLGLGALAWTILVADALTYGVVSVMTDSAIAAPEAARYALALAVGVVVNTGCAAALARLAFRTPGWTLPPFVQGLSAALLAAVVAGCALLLTLGIDPVDFVLAL